jgi:aryl-alcohol dehydrogenase-like predicted oxidoreductase
MIDRCILGTVQLGLNYGIANKFGMPDLPTATRLVGIAWDQGVRIFDTAQAYGKSETVLGDCLRALGKTEEARIVSKLPPDLTLADSQRIPRLIDESLSRLGASRLEALFLHREAHLALLDGPVGQVVEDVLASGRVKYFGVSTYAPEAAIKALEHPLVRIVQIPASIFDRRFEAAGIFDCARKEKKEVHVRSVLLQGALTLRSEELSLHLTPLAPALERFHSVCRSLGVAPAPVALAWALRRFSFARVLFGAETPDQVKANLDFLSQASMVSSLVWSELDDIFPPQSDSLLNPSLWKLP